MDDIIDTLEARVYGGVATQNAEFKMQTEAVLCRGDI